MTETDPIQAEDIQNPDSTPAVEAQNPDSTPADALQVQPEPETGLPDPAVLYPKPKRRMPVWLIILLAVLLLLGAGYGTLRLVEKVAIDQAVAALEVQDYTTAEQAAGRALSLPLKAMPQQAYLLRAQAVFGQGRLDETLDGLLVAVQAYPDEAGLQNMLAEVYLAKGELDKAYETGELARAIDDSLALPYALEALKAYNEYRWGDVLPAANSAIKRGDTSGLALRLRGALALWNEDFTAARADLEQAAGLAPDDIEIHALLVYFFTELSMDEEANEALENVKAISTDSAVSLWAQGLVAFESHLHEEAMDLAEQALALEKRPEFYLLGVDSNPFESPEARKQKKDYLAEAVALNPDFFQALIRQTKQQMDDYELDDFESAVQRLELLAPNSYSIPLLRCLHAVDEYYLDDAKKFCDLAVERAPEVAAVHAYAGFVHLVLNEFDPAWEDINRALDMKPDSITALSTAYLAASMHNETKKAMEYADQLIEINEVITSGHALKAKAYNADKEYKLALSELEKAAKIDPYDPEVVQTRIFYSMDSEDNLTALNEANDLVKRNPNDPNAYILRGWVYLADEKLDQAKKDANTALSLSKRLPNAYELLATIYSIQDDHSATIMYAEKSLDIYPYQAQPHMLIAKANCGLSNYEKCVDYSEKAAELAPWDDSIQLALANTYYRNGQIEEAVAVLEKLMEKKDDLDLDALDTTETLLDFLKTVAPLVNGERTQVDTKNKFSITYPNTWIPVRPETADNYEASLKWMISYRDYTDYVNLQLIVLDTSDIGQYPASLWASLFRSEFAKSSKFQFFGTETFYADGITGTAEEYQVMQFIDDDISIPVRLKLYFFVKGDKLYIFQLRADLLSYDEHVAKVDEIVKTFSVPK